MEQEFLSVRAFAVRAGVSAQAIYKRLTNENDELIAFLKEIDGKKTISAAALKLFQQDEAVENKNDGNSTSCQPVDNQLTTKIIDMLQSELEAKNRQIEHLQQLLSQEQQLHLLTKQELLALAAPAEDESKNEQEEQTNTAPNTEEKQNHKWWQFWK